MSICLKYNRNHYGGGYMEFTYEAYADLVDLLRKKDYEIVTYDTFSKYRKCAILRHDIDNSLSRVAF